MTARPPWRTPEHHFVARDANGATRIVTFYARSSPSARRMAEKWAAPRGYAIEDLPEKDAAA